MQHSRDNHLADPSQCANTFPSNCPASSSTGKCSYPPNLTNAEWTLLRDNEGCFKCHHAFEGKCDTPDGNNYLPVSQTFVDAAKKTHHNHPNNHVTAITIAQNTSGSSSAPESSAHPVADIMPRIMNPVVYHAANDATVLDVQ